MCNSECQNKVKDCIFIIQKLQEFGIKKLCKGYFYVIKVLDVVMNKKVEIKFFGEDVYPIVAEVFDVKVNTIERNIRNYMKIICRDCADKCTFCDAIKNLSCCKFIYKLKCLISTSII